MRIAAYWLIITLNENELNAPMKSYSMVEWIKHQDLYIGVLQETLFRSKDTQTESKGIEKSFHGNGKIFMKLQ